MGGGGSKGVSTQEYNLVQNQLQQAQNNLYQAQNDLYYAQSDLYSCQNMYKRQKKSDYDLQFLFSNLEDFATGFGIKNQMKQQYNQKLAFLVGMLGNFNSGKSYLLSKIIGNGTILEQGIGQSTQGFNIKVMQQNHDDKITFCIDTAGCGEPLQCFKNFQYEQNYLDVIKQKKQQESATFQKLVQCESFLQQYIASRCHVVIITVDIMNREDQKFIGCIIDKMKQRIKNGEVKLYIVHNFKQLQYKDDVQKKIEKDIQNSFSVNKEIRRGVEVYSDYYFGQNQPIEHLILGQENSQAGKHYNQKTIQYIQTMIENNNQFKQPLNIYKDLENYVRNSLGQYIDIKIDKDQQLKLCQSDQDQIYGIGSTFFMQQLKEQYKNNNNKLDVKEMFFDFLGRPIFGENIKIQPYDIPSNEQNIALVVDMPGIDQQNWRQNIKYLTYKEIVDNKNKLFINIKGYKNYDVVQKVLGFQGNQNQDLLKESRKLVSNPIKYEDYDFTILLTEDCLKYDKQSEQAKYINGQFILQYKVKNQGQDF